MSEELLCRSSRHCRVRTSSSLMFCEIPPRVRNPCNRARRLTLRPLTCYRRTRKTTEVYDNPKQSVTRLHTLTEAFLSHAIPVTAISGTLCNATHLCRHHKPTGQRFVVNYSSFFSTFGASGFIVGNRIASFMFVAFIKSIASRSIPIPIPPFGGIPYSMASR